MKIELKPETEAYIEASLSYGTFANASEFVEAAVQRQKQEEVWFEQKVLEGMKGQVTPLTKEDLDSVRDLVRKAHDRKAA